MLKKKKRYPRIVNSAGTSAVYPSDRRMGRKPVIAALTGDSQITVDEILTVVNNALIGCGGG
jgi:hypothetical protein